MDCEGREEEGSEMTRRRPPRYNYEIGPATAPVLTMRAGATVTLFIPDWLEGSVSDDVRTHPNVHRPYRCPAFGPIHVDGARPGMGLCVELLEINLAGRGLMALRPGIGVLGHKVEKDALVSLPIRDGQIEFPGGQRLPVAPMVGVIGVAPATGTVLTLATGDYGGNLDTREISTGALVHLPIQVSGAGLYVADVHAAMGDGELSGTGVEVSAEVGIRVSLERRAFCPGPLVESDGLWIALATDSDPKAALRMATDRLVSFLSERARLPFQEAYLLVGSAGNAAFSQVVNRSGVTCKVKFPKSVLAAR